MTLTSSRHSATTRASSTCRQHLKSFPQSQFSTSSTKRRASQPNSPARSPSWNPHKIGQVTTKASTRRKQDYKIPQSAACRAKLWREQIELRDKTRRCKRRRTTSRKASLKISLTTMPAATVWAFNRKLKHFPRPLESKKAGSQAPLLLPRMKIDERAATWQRGKTAIYPSFSCLLNLLYSSSRLVDCDQVQKLIEELHTTELNHDTKRKTIDTLNVSLFALS